MKIKVQLVLCAEDGREEEVHEIAMVEKPHQRIEHLGLTLAEAKAVLKMLRAIPKAVGSCVVTVRDVVL